MGDPYENTIHGLFRKHRHLLGDVDLRVRGHPRVGQDALGARVFCEHERMVAAVLLRGKNSGQL